MKSETTGGKQNDSILAVICNDISYIKQDVTDIKRKIENDYVTRDEFEPIRKVVYGMISVILLTVVGAIVALILK